VTHFSIHTHFRSRRITPHIRDNPSSVKLTVIRRNYKRKTSDE